MLKFLLPLIAALKAGRSGEDGWQLGVAVAQAYIGCKAEISPRQPPAVASGSKATNASASDAGGIDLSTAVSPTPPCCQPSKSPQCDREAPAMRTQTLGERIALIHRELQRCRQLGQRPPSWSDWDEILDRPVPNV